MQTMSTLDSLAFLVLLRYAVCGDHGEDNTSNPLIAFETICLEDPLKNPSKESPGPLKKSLEDPLMNPYKEPPDLKKRIGGSLKEFLSGIVIPFINKIWWIP